ncbi:hypothetical protein PR048_003974 [Dryococelus australis]|uniref:TRAPPC10/Trs130 N-terminal domain-containing protein n=1 Tax=Dryococelus australis TaxID=614101 RepID=A0ABQ9I455_9NEOP|nr:hypothetical protein PR048_003974 [Dryococelus australis]
MLLFARESEMNGNVTLEPNSPVNMACKPIITYAGDAVLFRTLEALLVEGLPKETVEWKRSYGRAIKSVSARATFIPFSKDMLPKGGSWQLTHQPIFHTFWTECVDVELYKNSVRDEIEAWLRSLNQHSIPDWLVVIVETYDLRKSNKLLPRTTVLDKIRSDFASKHPDRCLSVINPIRSESRSAESWHGLLSRVCVLMLAAYNRTLLKFEEFIRDQRERRNEPGWNFCHYFLLQEELAFVLEMLGVYDEALVQYDELDALFTQFVLNSNVGEVPAWLGSFQSALDSWPGLVLDRSVNQMQRLLLSECRASLLQFRSYLFSRQCTMLQLLQRPHEMAQRCLPFLHNCVKELGILEIAVPSGAIACWIFLCCLEVLNNCSASSEVSLEACAQHTAPLWAYARDKLQELGELCGLLPGLSPSSEQLHTVVLLSAGMGDCHGQGSRPSPTDILKEALSSAYAFNKHYLEMAELAMGTYKHVGRLRCARAVGRELAHFYLLLGQSYKAAAFLLDSLQSFQDEGWVRLVPPTQLELICCCRNTDADRYINLSTLVSVEPPCSVTFLIRHVFFNLFSEKLGDHEALSKIHSSSANLLELLRLIDLLTLFSAHEGWTIVPGVVSVMSLLMRANLGRHVTAVRRSGEPGALSQVGDDAYRLYHIKYDYDSSLLKLCIPLLQPTCTKQNADQRVLTSHASLTAEVRHMHSPHSAAAAYTSDFIRPCVEGLQHLGPVLNRFLYPYAFISRSGAYPFDGCLLLPTTPSTQCTTCFVKGQTKLYAAERNSAASLRLQAVSSAPGSSIHGLEPGVQSILQNSSLIWCKMSSMEQLVLLLSTSKGLVAMKTFHGATTKFPVEVESHVIWCPDLIDILKQEILSELLTQYVTDVRRVLKTTDGVKSPTATLILTFGVHYLPSVIEISCGLYNTQNVLRNNIRNLVTLNSNHVIMNAGVKTIFKCFPITRHDEVEFETDDGGSGTEYFHSMTTSQEAIAKRIDMPKMLSLVSLPEMVTLKSLRSEPLTHLGIVIDKKPVKSAKWQTHTNGHRHFELAQITSNVRSRDNSSLDETGSDNVNIASAQWHTDLGLTTDGTQDAYTSRPVWELGLLETKVMNKLEKFGPLRGAIKVRDSIHTNPFMHHWLAFQGFCSGHHSVVLFLKESFHRELSDHCCLFSINGEVAQPAKADCRKRKAHNAARNILVADKNYTVMWEVVACPTNCICCSNHELLRGYRVTPCQAWHSNRTQCVMLQTGPEVAGYLPTPIPLCSRQASASHMKILDFQELLHAFNPTGYRNISG